MMVGKKKPISKFLICETSHEIFNDKHDSFYWLSGLGNISNLSRGMSRLLEDLVFNGSIINLAGQI